MSNYTIVPVLNILTSEFKQRPLTLVGKKVKEIAEHIGSDFVSSSGKKMILKILVKGFDGLYIDNGRGGVEFLPEEITESSEIGDHIILKSIFGIDAIETDEVIAIGIIVTIDWEGDWVLSNVRSPLTSALCTAEMRRERLGAQLSSVSLIEYAATSSYVDYADRY